MKKCCIRVGKYDSDWNLDARGCGNSAPFTVDRYPICEWHMSRMFDPAKDWERWHILYSSHPDQHVFYFFPRVPRMPEVVLTDGITVSQAARELMGRIEGFVKSGVGQ